MLVQVTDIREFYDDYIEANNQDDEETNTTKSKEHTIEPIIAWLEGLGEIKNDNKKLPRPIKNPLSLQSVAEGLTFGFHYTRLKMHARAAYACAALCFLGVLLFLFLLIFFAHFRGEHMAR